MFVTPLAWCCFYGYVFIISIVVQQIGRARVQRPRQPRHLRRQVCSTQGVTAMSWGGAYLPSRSQVLYHGNAPRPLRSRLPGLQHRKGAKAMS